MSKKTKTEKLFKTIEVKEYDWNKIPTGSKFNATIMKNDRNHFCHGRIYKNNEGIYLCQDQVAGASAKHPFEYKYTWAIYRGTILNLLNEGVSNLNITLDPSYTSSIKEELKFNIGEYNVEFSPKGDSITVGCRTISFEKVEEIYSGMIALQAEQKAKDEKNAKETITSVC